VSARRDRLALDPFGLPTREAMQAIVDRAVKASTADGINVTVRASVVGNTRFAANQLSTAGEISDTSVAIESSFGAKHAVVSLNDLSDEGIRQAVARSEAVARLAPDDPDAMPPLGPQQYESVDAWFDSTAALTPSDRARAALTALQPARAAGNVTAAGYIVTGTQATLTGNKAGLSAFFRQTTANYTLTVRTSDGTGSGWAAADNKDWTQIDFPAVSARALQKAQMARNAVAVEPGRYTVILEPQAVGDLVQLMGGYLNARLADEGRSPFAKPGGGNKVGETIVSPLVTLLSDPTDPQLRSHPFDAEGFPLSRQVWIKDGVLQQLAYPRFWAKKQGKPFTGYPFGFGFGGGNGGLKLVGGTTTTEEMIKSTDRGVLVTRLWYLREVDPRTILYTGLTRDGTYLIEHGQVTHAVKNFRFNESPLFLLANAESLGPAVRLGGTEQGGDVVMPPVKAHDFTFTSLSDAV
jgi:predicted Zn-dependent protease